MNKMRYIFLCIPLLFLSCSRDTIKTGISSDNLIELIGTADSILQKESIPDVYTNKMIGVELWYYGTDTTISIVNNKVQNITIDNK